MYVCMSVCLYVCMSVCLYVCMSVCLLCSIAVYQELRLMFIFIPPPPPRYSVGLSEEALLE
jgi:hypothetical protein